MKKEKLTDDIFPDCKVVDGFVEQFNNGEIRLKPEANSIFMNKADNRPLTTLLSEAITNYVLFKSSTKTFELMYSKHREDKMFVDLYLKEYDKERGWRSQCLYYINYARNNNLLEETETLMFKLKKLEQEREEMKKLIVSLEKLNNELKKENDYLHKHFPDNQKGNTEIGELGKL